MKKKSLGSKRSNNGTDKIDTMRKELREACMTRDFSIGTIVL